MFVIFKKILKALGTLCFLVYLSTPAALATQPISQNYKLGNINFGQQMFLSTTDYSAPMILGAGPEVIELGPYSAKIKWFTDKTASSSIFYGTQSGVYDLETSKAYDNTTIHEIELTNLSPRVEYHFVAKSRDLPGNIGQSVEKKFTTPLPTPVVNNINVLDITENQAVLSFSTDYYATATVEYVNIASLEKNTVGEAGFSRDHLITIKNLEESQSFSCTIIARDDEGNESSSSSVSFTTLKDTKSPSIDNVRFDLNVISGKNKVRATIGWKTDEDSTSLVKFKESNTEDYVDSDELPDMVGNHFVTLPDMKPQTTYKMITVSRDKAGNYGQSEEFIILTPKQKRTFLQIILENIQQIFEPFGKLFNS